MKKRTVILCLAALCLCFALSFAAGAAGGVYVTGPEAVRPGGTVTLSFCAGGEVFGGSGQIAFDAEQLTFQGFEQKLGENWVVEFNGNAFLFYSNGGDAAIQENTEIFTVTFDVNKTLAHDTDVRAQFTSLLISNGKKDEPIGNIVHTVKISTNLPDNCNLAYLAIDGARLDPLFRKDILKYHLMVPYNCAWLVIDAQPEDPAATVEIQKRQLTVGVDTSIRIKVTAQNGKSQTYLLYAGRSDDPNFVASTNFALKSLAVEGVALSPEFSPEITQYYVWLPYEQETVKITAAPADKKAVMVIGEIPELVPGEGTDIPVTVIAEDGGERVYTVTAVRAPKHEDVEDFLSGEPEVTVPQEPPKETRPPFQTDPVEPSEPPISRPEEKHVPDLLWIMLAAACAMLFGIGLGYGLHRTESK